MTTLLLVRHGESEANRRDLFAGFYDPDLEELGVRQAEATAKHLAEHYHIDKVYASDLQRAYKTGKAIANRCGVSITAEPGMREISGGEWEAQYYPSLMERYPEEFGRWINDIANAGCPGGETVLAFSNRIMTTLEKIAKESEGKTVVVATHATPIRVIHTMLLHGSIACMQDVPWVSNASVTEVTFDGGKWNFVSSGTDDHLEGMKTFLDKKE